MINFACLQGFFHLINYSNIVKYHSYIIKWQFKWFKTNKMIIWYKLFRTPTHYRTKSATSPNKHNFSRINLFKYMIVSCTIIHVPHLKVSFCIMCISSECYFAVSSVISITPAALVITYTKYRLGECTQQFSVMCNLWH